MFRMDSPTRKGEADMGASRRKSEILAITGKITKALHDFDTLFLTSQDDDMVNDISSQIECLESGPLKYQLNNFVMRLKEVSASADQSCTERNEILESVMQWFNGQQFSQELEEIGINDDIDQGSLQLRDELVTTKIGFEKLQKLNEEMVSMKELGTDVGHLERERATLQQHAIMNFKSFKRASLDVKQEREMKDIHTKKDEMGEVWKNAAGEICGLLNRVRKDGGQYIEELEKKIRVLTSDMEEKSYYFQKMKRQLKEYSLVEQKWKDDNMSLMDQKALTKKRMGKYKRELKKTLEALAKYECVTVPKFLKEDDIDETKEANPLKTALEAEARQKAQAAAPQPVGGMNDPAILRAQLKDCRNQIEQLKGDKEVMSEEISQLKETLEDLEDDVLRLEKDKAELMYQMKQNSVRPNMRRLSIVEPGKKSSRVLSGSLTIVKLKGVESTDRGAAQKRCCKCGLKVTSPQHSKTQTVDTEGTDSGTDVQEDLTEGNQTKVQVMPSVIVDVKLKPDEEIGIVTLRCEDLERQLEELQLQLKSSSVHPLPHHQPTPEETKIVLNKIEQTQKEEVVVRPEPQEETETQVIEVVSTPDLPTPIDADPNPEPSPPARPDPLFKNTRPVSKGPWEALVVCHKSIQTDPQFNPLGPLSKGGQSGLGSLWKPPPPPPTWIEFDPTIASRTEDASPQPQVEPLSEAMLGGVEPSEVRQEAIECANLVHRELDRMTQGIQGFMNYTNTLVDRETRIIATTNRSQDEIHMIHQEMQQLSSSNVAPDQDRGNTQPDILFKTFINGGQPSTPSEFRGSGFLDNQLPVEERVKSQLGRIGQRSTDILKHAYDLVLGALSEQQREYEHIYKTVHDRQNTRPNGKQMELEDLEGHNTADLAPKRSRSHGNIKVTSAMSKTINIKEEVNIHKATISKKGQIILSTTPVETKSSFTMGIGKPMDAVHRKVKPVPMSHSKLKKKQDDLMHRGDIQRTEFKPTRLPQRQKSGRAQQHQNDRRSPASPSERKMSGKRGGGGLGTGGHGKIVLTDFELPADFFSEYTVGELEKTAMHFADQQKQHFHNEMLQKVHFPTLNKDAASSRQQTPGGNQPEDKFPKIRF